MNVVWNSALNAPPGAQISLSKPAKVWRKCIELGYDNVPAGPLTREDLYGVHDMHYVDDVCELRAKNGFGRVDPADRDHILAACGAMHKAAELALTEPGVPVLAPVSGFHHAHFADGYGFCTFNGLLATVAKLRREKKLSPLSRVLILDGDAHDGDGTNDILLHTHARGRLLDGVHNLCLKSETWRREIVVTLSAQWDLILYQAGADAHIDDPFGAGYLSEDDWRERDELVFTLAARRSIPIAWNLAGGYNGERTIELHLSTARSARLGANIRRRLDLSPAPVLEPRQEAPTDPARPLADDVREEGRASEG